MNKFAYGWGYSGFHSCTILLDKTFVVEDEIIHGEDHASEITDGFSGDRLVSSFVQGYPTGVDSFVCWSFRVQRGNIKGNKYSIGWKDVDIFE